MWARLFAPENLILTIRGSGSRESVLRRATEIFGGPGPGGGWAVSADTAQEARQPTAMMAAPPPGEAAVRAEQEMNKRQSYLRLGAVIDVEESDRPALEAANLVLSDRLQMDLRETQGLAYSIGSGLSPLGGGRELLAISIGTARILSDQKEVLKERYSASETSLKQVIERRKLVTGELEAAQRRIEELNPLLLDLENQMAASTDQTERTQLEGERSAMATEYNEAQAKEQELLAASQTLERYTSMFQTFVDSLNNQIAAQNTLINKLTIDTEQRIVLYKSLEDSLKTASQQEVAHQINTLGSKVDVAAEQTMAGIGAAAQSHIADLLEMHEKNMLSSTEIQRRKKLADEAFLRRFGDVMEKHQTASYGTG